MKGFSNLFQSQNILKRFLFNFKSYFCVKKGSRIKTLLPQNLKTLVCFLQIQYINIILFN